MYAGCAACHSLVIIIEARRIIDFVCDFRAYSADYADAINFENIKCICIYYRFDIR